MRFGQWGLFLVLVLVGCSDDRTGVFEVSDNTLEQCRKLAGTYNTYGDVVTLNSDCTGSGTACNIRFSYRPDDYKVYFDIKEVGNRYCTQKVGARTCNYRKISDNRLQFEPPSPEYSCLGFSGIHQYYTKE
jgi:hypothetical protein